MSIRIAQVNVARGFRGGERQTELLMREMAAIGVQQVLVARTGGVLAKRTQADDIEIRTVSGTALGVMRATCGVDIVHVHEGRSVYGAWLRSCRSGTPYVVTRRVNNPLGDHWLGHRAYRGASCIVAVAADIAAVVRRYDSTIPTRVIHSASSGLIANDAEVEAIRSRFAGKFLVGHVGALDNRQKGQEYILAVARAVQVTRPDIHFLLVGGGGDEVMLRSLAKGLSNVSFIGFVDNVGDYLGAFDVFILPSNKEGIGGILLDAMDKGLPVVASRVGGLPEIVSDGQNGLLIDPGRPDQLQAAVLRLAESDELRQQLGSCGRKFARDFTAAAMAANYLQLYESILRKTGIEQ